MMKYLISLLVIAGAVYFLTQRSNDLKQDLQGSDTSTDDSFGYQESTAQKKQAVAAVQNSAIVDKRTTASVPKEASQFAPERKLLGDLLTTSHQANSKPELREKARDLREKLMESPNAEAVLWEHYEKLLAAKSSPYERVEILDLLLTDKPNQKLADVALAEALQIQIPDTIHPEQAKTEKELNVALTTTPEMIPPIVAFDIYLKNCGAYANCAQGAFALIGSSANHNVRGNLISSLYSRFPQDHAHIRADLAKYDLK